jgi:SAM-dependent methyltransferase
MEGKKMWPRNSDKEWEKFGRNDPYYGVLDHDRFHKAQLDNDSLSEFFTSGQDHLDFVLKTIRASVDSVFSPLYALDFGCGVGRCSIPLTQVCQSVVGVDVSDSMLQEARKNCLEQSIANLQLVKSDDTLSRVSGPFDLVHAFLVFQHIPSKRGEKIFKRLIELLSDNGVAAMQFIYHREESALVRIMGRLRKTIPLWHIFVNLLYGKPWSEPLMEKNVYDLNRLLVILHEHGCGNVHMRFCGKGKLRSVVLFFQKKQDKVPHDAFEAY